MNNQEMEIAYMPSNWSKRYGPTELLARYFEFCQKTTDKVRCEVEHQLDISYGSTDRTKYDVYGTDLPGDAPILLFIHGGYWQEFSKDLSAFAVPSFVSNGIKVVIGGYDLCPNVTLTEIVEETKRLVESVLALARASGSKCVWISGHSAGAHLTASLLHDPTWLDLMEEKGYRDLIKGVLLIGGIYALRPLLELSLNEALKLSAEEVRRFTFAPFEPAESAADEGLEPIRNLKIIVVVGECDSPVFIEESRRYTKRLAQLVDNVEFLLIRESVDHFDIVEKLTEKDFVLSKLMLQNIKMSS